MKLPVVLVAIVSCAHVSPSEPPEPSGCVVDVGCPETEALAACTSEEIAGAVAAQTAVREHVQASGPSHVLVYGALKKDRIACTLLGCGGATCCNKCGGFLSISMGSDTGDADRTNALLLMGDGIGCSGDDSGICCTHEVGAWVVAEVDLHIHRSGLSGPSYHAKNARLVCAVPPSANLEEPRPLRVAVPEIDCDDPAAPAPEDLDAHARLLQSADADAIGDLAANQIGCREE